MRRHPMITIEYNVCKFLVIVLQNDTMSNTIKYLSVNIHNFYVDTYCSNFYIELFKGSPLFLYDTEWNSVNPIILIKHFTSSRVLYGLTNITIIKPEVTSLLYVCIHHTFIFTIYCGSFIHYTLLLISFKHP